MRGASAADVIARHRLGGDFVERSLRGCRAPITAQES